MTMEEEEEEEEGSRFGRVLSFGTCRDVLHDDLSARRRNAGTQNVTVDAEGGETCHRCILGVVLCWCTHPSKHTQRAPSLGLESH